MRNTLPLYVLPLLATAVVAQIPAPVSVLRDAPRAAWAEVTSVTAGTIPQRADMPGAASNDKLYLFGGCSGNNTATTLNDLWEFDGTSATLLSPTGTLPPARGRHAMAYDPSTDKLVLFGGDTRGTTNLYLNDVWEYDIAADAWTDITPPPGLEPTGRRWPGMAYDPATTGMLVFGGEDTTTGLLDDTWLFVGGVWVPMAPTNVPAGRSMAQLMTRPDFGDIIMVGGKADASTGYYRHDAWSWNGADWTLLQDGTPGTASSFKASGVGFQAAYDPIRKRVIIQGGNGIGAYSGGAGVSPYWTTLGNEYGGSPSQYTSEFDCLTNEWTIYANPQVDNSTVSSASQYECNQNDPVIVRVSRYAAGFVPALGKVFMMAGQQANQSPTAYQRRVYEYQADPIASSTINGAGCTGSAGTLSLAADDDPWTGRDWTLTGSGFVGASLTAAAIGFGAGGTQNVALSLVHPAGGAGCDLLVQTHAVILVFPTGGQGSFSLSIPDATVLGGWRLHTQMLSAEITGGTISLITSTNAVEGVIGVL